MIFEKLGTALVVSIGLTTAASAGARDLAGSWEVQWDDNAKNRNPLTLTIAAERLSGSYINDDKDNCTVTGNVDTKSRDLALSIICPQWDIRMQGRGSAAWNSVSGAYQAYINSTGSFTMKKN